MMRVLDKNGNELKNYDLSIGYVTEEKLFVKHHEAVEAVEEVWHYETVEEFFNPDGSLRGKTVEKVIDVPGVSAVDAWDEYETILRYTPYTPEQLAEREAERNKPTQEQRIAELEKKNKELEEALRLLMEGATE